MYKVNLAYKGIYRGDLILVNRHYKYQELDCVKNQSVNIGNNIYLNNNVAISLAKIMMRLNVYDEISFVSGLRSLNNQQRLYDQSLSENGVIFTNKYVAIPGHSEHQTGLAIDLGVKKDNIDFICPQFLETGICGEFLVNACKYGFIRRYPKGKEDITLIGYEPWHFRYVGYPHSSIIANMSLTLEEYHQFIKKYEYNKNYFIYDDSKMIFNISYLKADKIKGNTIEIIDKNNFAISGDNQEGFIICTWVNKDEYSA